MRKLLLLVTLGLLAACAAPQERRSNVIPLSAPSSHEVIVEQLSFSPGQQIATHRHPGAEYLYVASGSLSVTMPDGIIRTLGAGMSIAIPAMTDHSAVVGPTATQVVVTRIHPSGQPVRLPAGD